jgi:hypothetical protein
MKQNWTELNEELKQRICNEISIENGMIAFAVEKDWWVVQTIRLILQMDVAPHLLFKGGTSLSKAWQVIERFSEDIDLSIDRRFLGFDKPMTKSQVRKLRKDSSEYIGGTFLPALKRKFIDSGFEHVNVQLQPLRTKDQEPLIIEVLYPNTVITPGYIQPRVLVEIGSRSLWEPFEKKSFNSFIGEFYADRPFADDPVKINCVLPERTFLEKVFLLHEEFQKPVGKIRTDRLSRHLYDIEKLAEKGFAKKAINNHDLYAEIVKHRSTVNAIRGIDYAYHVPEYINPVPPSDVLKKWKSDYQTMQQQMIYGDSLHFDEVLKRIKEIKSQINAIKLT